MLGRRTLAATAVTSVLLVATCLGTYAAVRGTLDFEGWPAGGLGAATELDPLWHEREPESRLAIESGRPRPPALPSAPADAGGRSATLAARPGNVAGDGAGAPASAPGPFAGAERPAAAGDQRPGGGQGVTERPVGGGGQGPPAGPGSETPDGGDTGRHGPGSGHTGREGPGTPHNGPGRADDDSPRPDRRGKDRRDNDDHEGPSSTNGERHRPRPPHPGGRANGHRDGAARHGGADESSRHGAPEGGSPGRTEMARPPVGRPPSRVGAVRRRP